MTRSVDEAVAIGAGALCKLHGAGGCSMHCTFADQTSGEGCPRAVKVWGHEAKAVVDAITSDDKGEQ